MTALLQVHSKTTQTFIECNDFEMKISIDNEHDIRNWRRNLLREQNIVILPQISSYNFSSDKLTDLLREKKPDGAHDVCL